MTDDRQLDLFGNDTTECKYPTKKGTTSYSYGCRCPRCTEAWSDYARNHRRTWQRQWPPCLNCDKTTTNTTMHRTGICKSCRGGHYNQAINRHGLNSEQALRLINISHCESCDQELLYAEGSRTRRVDVDHDHAHCPGRDGCAECVRGFICKRCNRAAAAMEHPTAGRVMAYLAQWHTRNNADPS